MIPTLKSWVLARHELIQFLSKLNCYEVALLSQSIFCRQLINISWRASAEAVVVVAQSLRLPNNHMHLFCLGKLPVMICLKKTNPKQPQTNQWGGGVVSAEPKSHKKPSQNPHIMWIIWGKKKITRQTCSLPDVPVRESELL